MNIDFESLRDDLIDYYGTATGAFMFAFSDVDRVENASDDDLIMMAEDEGFDLHKYMY